MLSQAGEFLLTRSSPWREKHEAMRIVLEIVDQIQALSHAESMALPTGSRVLVNYALGRIGRSRQLPEQTAIYGTVFFRYHLSP